MDVLGYSCGMVEWLADRLFGSDHERERIFIQRSTFNWMRSLAIATDVDAFSNEELAVSYEAVGRRAANDQADDASFERLLMAQHHHSSGQTLRDSNIDPHQSVRLAIVAWYYTVYEASSAMIAAQDGSVDETHAGTDKKFLHSIVANGHARGPFELHTDSLVLADIEEQVEAIRNGCKYSLKNRAPSTYDESWGALCEYLKGTAQRKYEAELLTIKNQRDFKALGVSDFRTRNARELRDKYLKKKGSTFLTQAFRYRGKANYRDAIYLSYGHRLDDELTVFLDDLLTVSGAFLRMSVHFCQRRIGRESWASFIADLEKHSLVGVPDSP